VTHVDRIQPPHINRNTVATLSPGVVGLGYLGKPSTRTLLNPNEVAPFSFTDTILKGFDATSVAVKLISNLNPG
jgi:hypothetical protein